MIVFLIFFNEQLSKKLSILKTIAFRFEKFVVFENDPLITTANDNVVDG